MSAAVVRRSLALVVAVLVVVNVLAAVELAGRVQHAAAVPDPLTEVTDMDGQIYTLNGWTYAEWYGNELGEWTRRQFTSEGAMLALGARPGAAWTSPLVPAAERSAAWHLPGIDYSTNTPRKAQP